MRKKILSLCMALVLCLSLLPATARAITPRIAYDILWIGNTRITDSGYWTTDGNGNLMASDAGNYNIAFDADTNTLTLNNANIAGQYNFTYNNVDAGIYAYSRSGAVSLTIQVTGNNVVSGSSGIYALSNGGEVSVTISGGGSLTASGSWNGISIVSEFSSAALAIEGTALKASGSYGDGVQVQAGESSSGSLSVNGGSLTASGNTGIYFYFSTGDSGSGIPSLTVAGNAVVDAKGGGIAHNSSNNLSIQGNSGIVFNGSTGTVYGNASLQEDLIIGEGESLTLDNGASLNANGHNVIVDGGTLDESLAESLDGSVIYKVTKVELDKTSLTLQETDSATLTATVEPDNATNKNVNWESSDTSIATVDASGKVTAISAGSATITATAADGSGKSASCSVTVTHGNMVHTPKKDATCTAEGNKEYWTCGTCGKIFSDEEGKTEIELPATVIPATGHNLTKTEEKAPTCTAEGNTEYWTCETCGKHFSDEEGKTEIELSATVIPAVGHSFSGGTCTVCGAPDPNYTPPYIPPSKTPSQQAIDKIEDAKEGSTVKITLRTGQTKLDKEVFEELAGRDVTLEISLSNGVTWSVNGQDIPENADLTDLDLGVTLDASTIPVSVVNTITGAVDTIQISLKHDGEFGFTMTLSAPLGKTNAGYWANLYYYNEDSRALEFQSADKIASDGTAEFAFSHASDYAIVIDTDSHEPVELPFTDVPEGAWYEDAAAYVYKHGLMAGTSATTFAPDVTTSRAMIATILWRMAGSPVVNYAMNYTDVAQGQWCSEAIRWATSEGVVTGYGNGLFGTNDPITREQLATMLWRYAQTEGYDVSIGEDTNILSYTDVADLSEYAIPAMQWAVGAGIINGTGDGSTLTPQGQATRAQAATVLMRFCELQ